MLTGVCSQTLSSIRNRSLFFFFLVTEKPLLSVLLMQVSGDNPRMMKVNKEKKRERRTNRSRRMKIN